MRHSFSQLFIALDSRGFPPNSTALSHFLLTHCGCLSSQGDIICRILNTYPLYLQGQNRIAANLLDRNCSTSRAEKNSIHTPRKPSEEVPRPMTPPGLPGDMLFSVSVVMCFYREFAHITQPPGARHSGLHVGRALAAFISSKGQEGPCRGLRKRLLCCPILPGL